jgi:hypothetical protein
MIIHTEHKLKSMLLIIVSIITVFIFSTPLTTLAAEPEIITILFTSDNCPVCESTLESINSKINELLLVDERNTSDSTMEAEFIAVREECNMDTESPPLLVTQNGCFKTENDIVAEIEVLLELIANPNEEPNVLPADDSEEEDVVEATDEIQETTVKVDTPVETIRPEGSPLLALFSIAIPIFMVWAAFYIIKKLNL